MQQTISINLSHGELADLINSAVCNAIDLKMNNPCPDPLMTIEQASAYLNCSEVHIWKLRKLKKIESVNSGKKVLIPKSSIDKHLQMKRPQAA